MAYLGGGGTGGGGVPPESFGFGSGLPFVFSTPRSSSSLLITSLAWLAVAWSVAVAFRRYRASDVLP